MRNRSDLDIMTNILTCADTKFGTQKTKIMFGAFLSTTQLKDYLIRLEKDELIINDRVGRLFKTTNKGKRLIGLYKKMNDLMPKIEVRA